MVNDIRLLCRPRVQRRNPRENHHENRGCPTMETVNEAAVETVDELMVKMRKPLRYYDRRPEPKEPGLDASVGIKQRIVVIIIGIRIAIGVFGRRGNGIDLRRQSRRVLGDPPASIRLLARLHDALLLLAAHRYWNRIARARAAGWRVVRR